MSIDEYNREINRVLRATQDDPIFTTRQTMALVQERVGGNLSGNELRNMIRANLIRRENMSLCSDNFEDVVESFLATHTGTNTPDDLYDYIEQTMGCALNDHQMFQLRDIVSNDNMYIEPEEDEAENDDVMEDINRILRRAEDPEGEPLTRDEVYNQLWEDDRLPEDLSDARLISLITRVREMREMVPECLFDGFEVEDLWERYSLESEHPTRENFLDFIEKEKRCRISISQIPMIIQLYNAVNEEGVDESVSPSPSDCSGIKYVDILAVAETWLEKEKPDPASLTEERINILIIGFLDTILDASNCSPTAAERTRFKDILRGVLESYIEDAVEVVDPVDNIRDRACYNTESMSGKKLPYDLSGTVSFLHEGQNKAECYSRSDWHSILASAEDIGIWKPTYPKYPFGWAPVFKMPTSGVFVQSTQTMLDTFTCYQMESIGIKPIGSEQGSEGGVISSLHGAEEQIWIAAPIHLADFKAFMISGTPIPKRDWLKGPFIPLAEDLNPNMTKWADKLFTFTFNGQYFVLDPKSGKVNHTTGCDRLF